MNIMDSLHVHVHVHVHVASEGVVKVVFWVIIERPSSSSRRGIRMSLSLSLREQGRERPGSERGGFGK